MITLHCVVRDEERFIKAALLSVLSSSEVARALVWDTGSTDKTVSEIKSISDRRIEFSQRGKVDKKKLVQLRKEQIQLTKTPWILLVDGDEIWPEGQLKKLIVTMKQCSNLTIALVNRSRNVVGDVFHYLPESTGHYRIGPWQGHLNIRAIRNVKGLTVKGEYPNEWYELDGKKIQNFPPCKDHLKKDNPLEKCLQFVDTWYLHATHLRRSNSWRAKLFTLDRLNKRQWFHRWRGKKLLKMKSQELPVI